MKNAVTSQQIEELLANSEIQVQTVFDKVTIVTCKLPCGFVITEASGAVDKSNYDVNIGKEICMERITNKLWELEGYVLSKNLNENGTNPLYGTIPLMISKDYKERFIAEYRQLLIRYSRLKDMLSKWDKGELSFDPTCPRDIYDDQIKAMSDYISILEDRAAIEGINLQEV